MGAGKFHKIKQKFCGVQGRFFKRAPGRRRHFSINLFLYLFLTAASFNLPAFQPEVGAGGYIVRVWGIEDGLPRNSVSSLLRTRDGYIWFGTQAGLVRFDGVTARIYNRWNTAGLKNDRILSLYEDKNGTPWVGTDGGGISRLKEREWTTYTTANGLSGNTVRAIAGDKNNNLWIGTDNGLNYLEKGKIKVYTMPGAFPGCPVTALVVGGDGTVWIGTGGSGLKRIEDGKFQDISSGKDLPPGEITALHEDHSGRLWIGSENGLYYREKGKIRRYGTRDNTPVLTGISIKSIMEDSRGYLWAGTEGEGVYRLKSGAFTAMNTSRGLPDDYIYSLLEDHEGNIWLGTYTTGLVRLKTAAAGSITRENGLPENKVQTVLRDDNGYLWVGGDRKGLTKIKIKDNTAIALRTFTTRDGLTGDRVRSLCLDREKNLWIGTTAGLNKMQDGKIRGYTTGDGLSANHVTAIFQQRSGTLWVGTITGLNRFEGGEFTVFAGNTHIRTIGENRAGNLRVGTVKGLFLLQGGDIKPFAPDFDYDVSAFYEDAGGDLWVGTGGSGLIRFKTGSPALRTVFTTGTGLPGNNIFSIIEDSGGNMWMSSYRGVFRVSKKELTVDNPASVTALSFDEKEGMRSRECVPGGQPSAWKTPAGKLFIPTIKGVAVFDTAAIRSNSKPPPVIIETVIADNRAMITSAGKNKKLSFPSETRVIEFYFTALSFTAPGKVRFRYMLEGYDTRWHETVPRQKRAVFYLNLPAGNYRFKVTACNNAGVWNQKGARLDFEITAPFYKRPVFYILVLLCLAVIAGSVFLLLNGKRKKKIEAAAKDEKENAKEKYKTSALLPETAAAVLPQLTKLMEEEKLFLEPDLTLKKLSQRLQVHYNHLSQIINERLGKSFNDYINSYRIEEAKKKLTDPKEAGKTVLEIAYDTGFYSKSVFNTAFKKFTGMTPSRYREKMKG